MKRLYIQMCVISVVIVLLAACASTSSEPSSTGAVPTTIYDAATDTAEQIAESNGFATEPETPEAPVVESEPEAEPEEVVEEVETIQVEAEEVDSAAVSNGPLQLADAGDLGVDLVLAVDVTNPLYPINPFVYGINFGDDALIEEANIPLRRRGGNATTRYNWQADISNRASDWFFLNFPNPNDNPEALPVGSISDRFIAFNESLDVETINTISMLGWMPDGRVKSCSFPVEIYGEQQRTEPNGSGCGNGVDTNGEFIENDPFDVHIQTDRTFAKEFIAHLIDQFGSADDGGVRFYSLDNEPMLWFHTHRDVRPQPLGYDEFRDISYDYASAIKEADPAAETFGPVLWGWTAYSYSSLDMAEGGSWWSNPPDNRAHGGVPLAAWYLQEMARYEEENGVRLLDYFDLHFYPQVQGVALNNNVDPAVQEARLRSTRSLWDIDYVDESWIDEEVKLIPRMKEWVNQYYPGTKLAITEYNWGATNHINGALAQADILGIFGREQLDVGAMWSPPALEDPAAFSFKMYRNYDGNKSTFGDQVLPALSSDQDQVSVYAAVRESDGAKTIIVINKSMAERTVYLDMPLAGSATAEVYRYSEQNLTAIEQLDAQEIENGFQTTLPTNSITLYVLR